MNDSEVKEIMLNAYNTQSMKDACIFLWAGMVALVLTCLFVGGVIVGHIGVNIYESMQTPHKQTMSVEK